jgi:serine/threonine protein kinase
MTAACEMRRSASATGRCLTARNDGLVKKERIPVSEFSAVSPFRPTRTRCESNPMHDPSIRNPAYQSLTDQQFFEIDELCDRFDQKLVSGNGPRIETFLVEAPEAARHSLLAELLTIEIEHRCSRGEQATADEYVSRFPDQVRLIEDAFDFARESDVPTGSIARFDEATVTIAVADTARNGVGTSPELHRAGESPFFTPQSFGRYTLLRLLGKGGMGSVYLAHDSELDRRVAIKFPEFDGRPDVATAAIERFRREARAMATIQHSNICPIFDVGQHEGRHFLTMGYVDGQSLSEAVGTLSQVEIVRLIMMTAHALHAAHLAGVVHRDLKPSNVMLHKHGEPIVTDFGLASRASVSECGLTQSGLIIGSPAYMAPEQVEAEHDKVGPRTDVYALGVIFYQLLTGRRPFEGTGLSVLGKIAAGIRPESPSQIAAVPPALEAICLKAMAHQIEHRFASAEELADSLAQWLKTADIEAVQARRSRWKAVSMAGGIAVLALSSLLMAIANRPDSTEKLPGFQETDEVPASGTVTASDNDHPRLTHAPEMVPDDVVPALLIAPFDEQQARAGQQEWADHLGLPVEYTNSIGMTFRLIPPGEYLMGNTSAGIEAALKAFPQTNVRATIESEGPQRKVLTKAIYLGVTEVTQSQYEQVMGTNPSCFSATGRGKDAVVNLETDDYPVESVSRFNATDFCLKLNQHELLRSFASRSDETAVSVEETGYRLPTEAEWEFACRAGTDTAFSFDESVAQFADYGWFLGNADGATHPVRGKEANPWGLYDTYGNAWEWCLNRPDEYPSDPAADARDLLSGEGVLRGGSWKDPAAYCRSVCRTSLLPDAPFSNCGFRVALTADAVKVLLSNTGANVPPAAVTPFDEKRGRARPQPSEDRLDASDKDTNPIGMKFLGLRSGKYTFINNKGDRLSVLHITLHQVGTVTTSAETETNGVYRVETPNGWLAAAVSDAGAIVNVDGSEGTATDWELHKHSKGHAFAHMGNRANFLSLTGVDPKGGGEHTGEYHLRRANAGGNGMEDQLWQVFEGYLSEDGILSALRK